MKFFVWDDPYLFKYYTKFLGGVCLTMRLEVSSPFLITKHVRCISVGRRQLLKSFSVVYISQLYLGILLSTVSIILGANSWVGIVKGT